MKRLSKKQGVGLAIAITIIGGAVAAFMFGLFGANEMTVTEPPEPSYSKLTGVEVSAEQANLPILGVMIENSELARPQTGLNQAGIVFEATTEGGITRFLALYQEDTPETLGPVRSLRTHFLNWAMGFETAIAHVGGSAEALDLVEKREAARSLSEFRFSEPYYRENSREAPHNMYARGEDLRNLMMDQGYQTSSFADIPRSDDTLAETPEVERIVIDFSAPAFLARFDYNAETNRYGRLLAGQPHIDHATNEQISVKNVIVMQTRVRGDNVTTLGNGTAVIFKDGRAIDAAWRQDDFTRRITFIDPTTDQEIPLNRGNTWIAVVSDLRRVDY